MKEINLITMGQLFKGKLIGFWLSDWIKSRK